MRKPVLFTTSWDDGHPLDMRVAELLDKYGLTGTFYVPGRVAPGGTCNPDGFDVMPAADLRQLARAFEVGSHSLDHRTLTGMPVEEARHQILAGKAWLEDVLGQATPGFCYPNGVHDAAVRNLVRECGFEYGRTTEDLYDGLRDDPFNMPVTVHFYPKTRKGIVRSFLREERRRIVTLRWSGRIPVFLASIGSDDFASRFRSVLDRTLERGGVFHMWGHSWEIEKVQGWALLEDVFRYAASQVPIGARVTNHQLACASQLRPDPLPMTGFPLRPASANVSS